MHSNTASHSFTPASSQPLTVLQAAEALNVSPFTVRAWMAQRRLGFVRLGRAVRVPESEVRRLLDGGFVPAAAQPAEVR